MVIICSSNAKHVLCVSFSQLENLVYYNRLKHSKIVISDFHLAKLENGLIKEPCGTPEYLGRAQHRTLVLLGRSHLSSRTQNMPVL